MDVVTSMTLYPDRTLSSLCFVPKSLASFSCKSYGKLQVCNKCTSQGIVVSCPIEKRGRLGRAFCSVRTVTYDEFALESHSESVEQKVGVLLLNLGGPETLDDVQPFLFNLFADPDIIRLPRLFRFLQEPLAKLISTFRAPKSKEGYASIGGGSPLRKITNEQAQALKMALVQKKLSANVYVGMRYWYPFTEEAIQQIKRDGITRLVVLPLYPQYSICTTGSSIHVLQKIFRKVGSPTSIYKRYGLFSSSPIGFEVEPQFSNTYRLIDYESIREDAYLSTLPVSIIKSWYQREGYIKSMADLIQAELNNFVSPQEAMIFFSAHGVPVSYVENAGDPYKDQMEECIYLIMQELKARGIGNDHTLAYQSRVGPVKWLKPYTDEVLVELGQKGIKSLLAVPVSFVSEHIETLDEIDMEYKHLALQSGIENWGRVPALNCKSSFIEDLADAVVEALPSALALSPHTSFTDADDDRDLFLYAIRLLFGSILAFLLLLSPKTFLAIKNNFI